MLLGRYSPFKCLQISKTMKTFGNNAKPHVRIVFRCVAAANPNGIANGVPNNGRPFFLGLVSASNAENTGLRIRPRRGWSSSSPVVRQFVSSFVSFTDGFGVLARQGAGQE